MIKVYCNGTRIQCLRQGELTVGMAGAPIEFDFSEEWNGLTKIAVFRCDGARDVLLSESGEAIVPHEILTVPGMDVEVGVHAIREDGTTWPSPTTYCKIGRVKAGADPSGDESYPPTPDIGEQAVKIAMDAVAKAEDVIRRAEAGEFIGEKGDKGDRGEQGEPGYTPQKGVDYWTGEDKREIIDEVTDATEGVVTRVDTLEVNMESVLKDIADLKYVPISISSFSVNPGSAEMGDVVQSVNLTYGINKKPAALYLDGVEKTNPASGGGFQFNNLSLTADKTWTLKAVDERNKEVTKQATLKFYNNVYYGVAGQTMPAIANLTAVLTDTRKRTVTVNAAAGEYIWYFVPVRLGACTFTVGGFDGGFDLVATQDVTNASGYTESFRIYRSSNAGLGSTTVEVK